MEYEEGFCCQVTSSCIVFFYVEEEHEVRKSFFRFFAAFLFSGCGFFWVLLLLSFGGLGDEYGGWLMLVFRREGSSGFW
jgi:hypothetical protein